MLAEFNAPPRDRYQVITQHDEGEMIFEDTGLGFERTNKLVFVQIFQQGRTPAMKKAIYASICSRLNMECDGASAFPSPRGRDSKAETSPFFPQCLRRTSWSAATRTREPTGVSVSDGLSSSKATSDARRASEKNEMCMTIHCRRASRPSGRRLRRPA